MKLSGGAEIVSQTCRLRIEGKHELSWLVALEDVEKWRFLKNQIRNLG